MIMKEILNQKIESFLDETMKYHDLPGLAAGVYCGRVPGGSDGYTELHYTGVRGYADHPGRVPLMKDDIFHCASVSKLFTASSIMKLVEADILHLDDRLVELLPDLHIADKRCESIRLSHMLTHTSGLGDCEDYHWDTPLCDDDALKRYVYSDEVCGQPMIRNPGTGFGYSNVAYEILGHIVSVFSPKLAGRALSYEDFVAGYCLGPAGMTASTMKTYARDGSHMARPHNLDADRTVALLQHYPYTRQHAPSSTLTSNTADLIKWARAHLQGSRSGHGPGHGIFENPAIYDTIWHPYAVVPNNGEMTGLGWFMRRQKTAPNGADPREYTLYGHEGSDDGFRSSFWICPELDAVTVVLSNISKAPVKKINKNLFAVIAETL